VGGHYGEGQFVVLKLDCQPVLATGNWEDATVQMDKGKEVISTIKYFP
jgi:hypothetical protein